MARVSRNRTLQMAHASLEAKRKLDLQKIFMPSRPGSEYPDLPEDPTELDDSALMRAMTQFTKWAEFLSAQLAVAEVDERSADAYLARVKAIKALANSTEKTVTAAKARAWEDEDFVTAHDTFQEAHAYRKLVQVRYENAERSSGLLSRELTRRVNRTSREDRVDRWG